MPRGEASEEANRPQGGATTRRGGAGQGGESASFSTKAFWKFGSLSSSAHGRPCTEKGGDSGHMGLPRPWSARSGLGVGSHAGVDACSRRACRERERERESERARERKRQRESERDSARDSERDGVANALDSTRLLPTMAAIAQQVAGTSWASPMYTHWVLGTSMQARPGQGGGPKSGRPERGNLPGRRQPRASQSSARMSLVCVPLRWRRA